jgi:branched-chain amino acid transport system permease protein
MSTIRTQFGNLYDCIERTEQYPTTLTVVGIALAFLIMDATGISLTHGIRIMTFALGAYGVHLLYGYTGLLSFGHAAFFGIGAFATTIGLADHGLPVMPALGFGMVVSVIFAAVIGYLSIQQFGIYFAILTLAFAEFLRFLTLQDVGGFTGGFQGVTGLFRRPEVGVSPLALNLNNTPELFAFVALILVVNIYILRRLLLSQLGTSFVAVRENEDRAKALGYNVQRIKLISFTVSGAITGVAGGLWAINIAAVTPDALNWQISGEFIFIIILGGIHQLLGPIVGSTLFFGLIEGFGVITDRRFLFVGLLLIGLVIYAPEGVWPYLKDRLRRFVERE